MRLPFVTRRRHEQIVSTAGMLREYGDTVGRSHAGLLRRNLELIAERDRAQRERDEVRQARDRLCKERDEAWARVDEREQAIREHHAALNGVGDLPPAGWTIHINAANRRLWRVLDGHDCQERELCEHTGRPVGPNSRYGCGCHHCEP